MPNKSQMQLAKTGALRGTQTATTQELGNYRERATGTKERSHDR